jgi:hypothetical protein
MRAYILLFATACVASPALADHTAPTAVGVGGGITVLGPDQLDAGHWALGFRLTYTRPDQRSDEELEALAADHVHAHNSDYNAAAAAGFAYGLTDRLTLSADLPFVRRDGLREGEHSHVGGEALNEVVELGDVTGFGDLSVLAKYSLARSKGGGLALLGGIKLPTGSTHKRSDQGERLETEHQPGTGSWDPIIGAAAGMKLDGLQLNASALYQFSGKGAQHTRLGDRAQGGLSLSHRFGPAEHHHDGAEDHHDHGGGETAEPHAHDRPAHGHQSVDAFVELTGEWEGRQKVDGEIEAASGGRSIWLTPGARFNSASGSSIAAAFGLPVWQHIRASHPQNDYRLTLSIGRAF